MIYKSYLVEKDLNNFKNEFMLFYGENLGLKDEFKKRIKSNYSNASVQNFSQETILLDKDLFYNEVFTNSLFESEKIFFINNSNDKILEIIEYLETKKHNRKIYFFSDILDKKSKLRTFFEKDNSVACVPFYKDNDQSLINIILNFCQNKKINISQQNINLIIQKTNGNRQSIKNELEKIESYSLSKKTISEEDILKIINVTENHDISSLVDYCLTKDKKKIVEILNDNNFALDEVIKIIRVFLAKSKRLQILITEVEKTNSIDRAIAEHKPPIFWKDKNMVKRQLQIWKKNKIIELIYKINSIELLTKKNSLNSLNILLDFIFSETALKI